MYVCVSECVSVCVNVCGCECVCMCVCVCTEHVNTSTVTTDICVTTQIPDIVS